MPLLYHYTSHNALEGIFRSGNINPGAVAITPKEIRANYAVCLTSDADPSGHGLPDGREISQEQAIRLGYARRSSNRLFSVDLTKFRLKIEIQKNDENLIHHSTLHASCPAFTEIMEAMGYLPYGIIPGLDPKQSIEKYLRLLRAGRIKGKSHTWWYYRGLIPLGWVVEIGMRVDNDQYVLETPDRFRSFAAAPSSEDTGRPNLNE